MFTKAKALPLSKKVEDEARGLRILGRFKEKIKLLEENPRYPSLRTKLLQPHHRGIWQIYITRRYRAHFITRMIDRQTAEVEFIFIGDPHK